MELYQNKFETDLTIQLIKYYVYEKPASAFFVRNGIARPTSDPLLMKILSWSVMNNSALPSL